MTQIINVFVHLGRMELLAEADLYMYDNTVIDVSKISLENIDVCHSYGMF